MGIRDTSPPAPGNGRVLQWSNDSAVITDGLAIEWRPSVSVSGQKFEDHNGDGVKDPGDQGLPGVTIFADLDFNTTLGPGEPNAVTDGGGNYTLTQVPNGTQDIREVVPAGFTPTLGPVRTVVLTADASGLDFGNFENISISGTKFDDTNGDGVKDPGEPGIPGWLIDIDRAPFGSVDATATTGPGGAYTVPALGPGTYRVREQQVLGWLQTTGDPPDVVAASGVNVAGIDFGNFKLITISGKKFDDTDKDGVLDPGELGVPGITIFLDENGNNTFDPGEPSTTTDGNGDYSFPDLGPGTYFVRESLPPQAQPPPPLWIQTTPNPDPIIAVSGVDVTGVNFGNKRLPRMLVFPTTIPFGNVFVVGTGVVEKAFHVTNVGLGDLRISIPNIAHNTQGQLCPDFKLLTGPRGTPVAAPGVVVTIPPGTARAFWVRFKPTRLGLQNCFFRVRGVFPFDDPNLPFLDVNVHGNGR